MKVTTDTKALLNTQHMMQGFVASLRRVWTDLQDMPHMTCRDALMPRSHGCERAAFRAGTVAASLLLRGLSVSPHPLQCYSDVDFSAGIQSQVLWICQPQATKPRR